MKPLGTDAFSIPAYENHDSDDVSSIDGVYLGLKYQCVEYARRWLYLVKGLSFEEVDFAYQIWDLDHLFKVSNKSEVPLLQKKNNPSIGDLVIYNRGFRGTGHVAVVSGIEEDGILLSEQNYDRRPWSGNYSRKVSDFGKEEFFLGFLGY